MFFIYKFYLCKNLYYNINIIFYIYSKRIALKNYKLIIKLTKILSLRITIYALLLLYKIY